jgi:ferredoxin
VRRITRRRLPSAPRYHRALAPLGALNLAVESKEHMAYVIAEPCIGTKDNSCVEVCPVDCIHPTPEEPDYDSVEMLYIDPDECIDCDACVEACPVDACFAEDQLPDEWQKYTETNAQYYKAKD